MVDDNAGCDVCDGDTACMSDGVDDNIYDDGYDNLAACRSQWITMRSEVISVIARQILGRNVMMKR